jgi:hypothetical protein
VVDAEKQMIKRQMLKKPTLQSVICFLTLFYLILFPFGQLLRREISLYGVSFALHPIDLVVLLNIPLVFLPRMKPNSLRKPFLFFVYTALFSLLVSFTQYSWQEILHGSFYLLRFVGYYFFFEMVWNYTHGATHPKIGKSYRDKSMFVIIGLVLTLLVTMLFGWIQYFFVPDLRYLKSFGWDDHLYRLTGTILDPGFMGILMVLGFLISLAQLLEGEALRIRIVWGVCAFLFFVTTLFTYSRGSYLAMAAGVFVLFWRHKKMELFFSALLILVATLFLLPRGEGEGVRLERTHSVYEKFKNYDQTLEIISDYPLIGIGFNTLCTERVRRFNDTPESHACSGSDSSILFLFATTGIIGLLTCIKMLYVLLKNTKGSYGEIVYATGAALLVHSLFLNSLFYPWVMGVIALLLAVSRVRYKKARMEN